MSEQEIERVAELVKAKLDVGCGIVWKLVAGAGGLLAVIVFAAGIVSTPARTAALEQKHETDMREVRQQLEVLSRLEGRLIAVQRTLDQHMALQQN